MIPCSLPPVILALVMFVLFVYSLITFPLGATPPLCRVDTPVKLMLSAPDMLEELDDVNGSPPMAAAKLSDVAG